MIAYITAARFVYLKMDCLFIYSAMAGFPMEPGSRPPPSGGGVQTAL